MNREILVPVVLCFFFTIEIFGAPFLLNNRPHSKNNINYRISKYSKNLDSGDTDKTIAKAFRLWSKHTDLAFTRDDDNDAVDIDIRFEVEDHGDGFAFDGPGGVLAHALRNFVHFDDDEQWTTSKDGDGTSLFKVAVHEIGHALGLGHSDESHSIMFFGGHENDADTHFSLHEDDIVYPQEYRS